MQINAINQSPAILPLCLIFVKARFMEAFLTSEPIDLVVVHRIRQGSQGGIRSRSSKRPAVIYP